ncbi:MAG: alcohol dehydrogenase catalytic domain-containing protein [Bryobacteraceae bacterium]
MISVHLAGGLAKVRRSAVPARAEGFSLIRLLAAGICNTDLELQRGYYGFRGRPGHEFVGEVVASDTKALIGKRVVGEINLACRRCEWCSNGLGRHCPARTVLGIVRHPGAFAEFLTLPDANLHVVPARISTERAVFVEPVAAACEILDQVKIPKGAKVAVLGDGKLGLLIAQVLTIHGAQVMHYGRHREKLAISAAVGAATEVVRKRLPQAEFGIVVDATGSPAGLETAIGMTRPRGTVVMKSTVHGAVSFNAATSIVNEITLVGSRCGRFEPALRMLPKLKLDEMVAARYPLSLAPAAFERAASAGVLKVLLTPA